MKIKRPESRQQMPEDATLVFKGKLFDVYQWQQQMYDGTYQTFEKLKRPDTVVVFAVLDDGSILLTKQEQPGKSLFIGAAGGRVDEGEETEEAAARELLEETGYRAKELILWHSEQPVSKIDWAVYTFIAKGLEKVDEQRLDAGEKITLHPVTFDEFIDTALRNEFTEREIVKYIYEAKIDKQKLEELRELFRPITQ
ncbi:NUDIX domain-containing protein [Candidatus Saccharibacteria bacterium]|jgi:8-oxo-dGTP pyrophosphatase MutT (NUDIX family)|nr:NUDIX domain-containing protein [Candidatus Saccharibacteria bacterium]